MMKLLEQSELELLRRVLRRAKENPLADQIEVSRAGKIVDMLESGKAAERILLPIIDAIDDAKSKLEEEKSDYRQGGPREYVEGRIAGLERAKWKVCAANTVVL